MSKIGWKITKYRKEKGISQKELAEAIGYSQAAINYWEKDKRTPSIDAALDLSAFFGTSISEFLSEEDIVTAPATLVAQALDWQSRNVIELFNRLNTAGKKKALSYLEDLVDTPKYKI